MFFLQMALTACPMQSSKSSISGMSQTEALTDSVMYPALIYCGVTGLATRRNFSFSCLKAKSIL